MLIDTDVLIWLTRAHAGAATRLLTLVPWKISAASYMELMQGCRDKMELTQIKKGLIHSQTTILHVNSNICECAIQLVEQFSLSHHMRMGDAFIAATALEHGLPVLTANAKHFSFIADIRIEIFTP